MRDRRAGGAWAWLTAVAAAVALATAGIGGALAQPNDPAKGKAAGKAARKGAPQGGARRAVPNAADPLDNVGAADALDKNVAAGMAHYRLKIRANDGTMLTMVYYPVYPARLSLTAPVVMMIHEKDRSSRDFEEPIAELKGKGFAEHLQELGYGVLIVNLRGQGANARKALTPQDWKLMVDDLQAAYQFLVDRHNRGKLNLSRLGVLALGEGANLAAAWAGAPGGAVSSEGRTSDLGAMVLISPLPDGEGFLLRQVLSTLAPRFPLLLMVADRDPISADPVRAVRPIVERPAAGLKLNRVERYDSSLHGYKLLWLEPGLTATVTKFFEGTIKLKAQAVWEPRYNLTPVAYSDIQLVRPKAADPDAAKKAEAEPAAKKEPAPGEPKAKAAVDAPK